MTDTFSDKQNSLAAYEKLLAPYREKFAARPALSMLQSTVALPAELLQLFMLHYSAFGISMTHPVEGWIRRAGERCNDTGYSALGEALIKHARHEAGHHRLMVADLWSLADAWNAEHAKKINPVALSRQKLPSSIAQYRALHEEVITGDTPYAQIAIEYEIEALSVRHGPALLAAACASNAASGSSFLREHISIDSAHTQFNREQIAKLLFRHPECLKPLVQSGAAALEIYGRFIDDCAAAAASFGDGQSNQDLVCRLFGPPNIANRSIPKWLTGVRSLRSHVLFDGGSRPAFGPGGDAFGDPDPLDLHCYHFVLQDGDNPVGAARLVPPSPKSPLSVVDAEFGRRNVHKTLLRAGVHKSDCAEVSRLIVHPDYRQYSNPRLLFAGLWTLAALLNARAIIAAVGTDHGLDRLYTILGAEMLDGAGHPESALFNDVLRLAIFRVDPASPPDYPELDHMRELIKRTLSSPPAQLTA